MMMPDWVKRRIAWAACEAGKHTDSLITLQELDDVVSWLDAQTTQQQGEWVPIEGVEGKEARILCACGKEECWTAIDVTYFGDMLEIHQDVSDQYGKDSPSILINLPDDIRLCRRTSEPTAEAKTLEQANEYIAELERELMDTRAHLEMLIDQAYGRRTQALEAP